MVRVGGAVVDEPVVGVEDEDLGRAGRAVRGRRLLRLVVEEREDEALLLGSLPHVLRPVAEIPGVRVDRDERRASRIVARDGVQTVLPRDDVRAVTAREDDGERLSLVVRQAVRAAVRPGQRELGSGVTELERRHGARI